MRSFTALTALFLAACASQAPTPATPPPPPVVAPPAPAPLPNVHVQVLAFNDFHGNIEPPHGNDGTLLAPGGEHIPAGGAVYFAAHMRRLAGGNPNTVIVSAGDLTGASPLVSNLFRDEPTVAVMSSIGLDFEGVGNHDFDRGLTELTRLQRGGPRPSTPGLPSTDAEPPFPGARFQYLAANVLGQDGKPVFPPYAIKELSGVKVAFIGMTLEGTRMMTTKEAVEGLTFANEAKTANALLPELRQQGVAATVILLHQGGFQDEGGTYDSCQGLKGELLPVLGALDPAFRVVVTAHTHQGYDCTVDGRLVTSAASYGRAITTIDLTLDPNKKELVAAHARNVAVTRDIAPDPEVAKIVADYEAKASPVTERVVGYQRGSFTRDPKAAHSASCESPMGDLIVDAFLSSTRNAGAVLALMNPGGIRADLTPPGAPDTPQPIPYAAAFEIQPFGNHLVTLSLTGAELHTLLEQQFKRDRPRVLSVSKGFSYRYAFNVETKVVEIDPASLRLDGKVIDPKKQYRVTVNSFLANGNDGFAAFQGGTDRTEGVLDIDALVAYLTRTTSARAPVTPPLKLSRIVGNGCE